MGFVSIIIAAFFASGSATNIINAAHVGLNLNANLVLADTVVSSSVCEEGFVHCLNGSHIKDGTTSAQSCHAACNGSCCTDRDEGNACENFSGSVCKDGSCNASNGSNVCKDATIEQVINSCVGNNACMNAGINEGFVGKVVNSCRGNHACYDAGVDGGSIGIIENSCREGLRNCVSAGAMGGSIGIIKNSCRDGDQNCVNAAEGGSIGSMKDSCQSGNRNCLGVAAEGGSIDSMKDSCQFGSRNCLGAAAEEGSIGYIVRSCSGTEIALANESCTHGEGVDIHVIEDIDHSAFEIVDCRGGTAYANGVITEQSCQVACSESGGSCCEEDNACDGFTGLVRTDGSCSGPQACRDANIGLVVNSCVGQQSCDQAGLVRTDGSCSGPQACYGAKIGLVVNSCVGQQSCDQAGGNGADGVEGHIGSISNSCHGSNACGYAASGGSIGTIENSCNNGEKNCNFVAQNGGSIRAIESSCSNGKRNCMLVARNGGSIGHIISSCSGTADGLVNEACAGVGDVEGGPIDRIGNCCNGVEEACCQLNRCAAVVETLPAQCAEDLTVGIRGFARRFAD